MFVESDDCGRLLGTRVSGKGEGAGKLERAEDPDADDKKTREGFAADESAAESPKKFAASSRPYLLRMDSGWNCTPQWGCPQPQTP